MLGYPLNLILAVATASATIFLGFLPTKSIRNDFFTRETLKAAIAWILVALALPPATATAPSIAHYPIFFALLCGGSWWKFRHDNALSGKLWLSIGSGLGISIGVMLILAVTPAAYPPNLPQLSEVLLLASIYLGGGVIGLAYIVYILAQSVYGNSGVTYGLVRRYVGLLWVLVMVRAAVLLAELFGPEAARHDRWVGWNGVSFSDHVDLTSHMIGCALALALALMIILAFLARRAVGMQARVRAGALLVALMLVGMLTEIVARLLVL